MLSIRKQLKIRRNKKILNELFRTITKPLATQAHIVLRSLILYIIKKAVWWETIMYGLGRAPICKNLCYFTIWPPWSLCVNLASIWRSLTYCVWGVHKALAFWGRKNDMGNNCNWLYWYSSLRAPYIPCWDRCWCASIFHKRYKYYRDPHGSKSVQLNIHYRGQDKWFKLPAYFMSVWFSFLIYSGGINRYCISKRLNWRHFTWHLLCSSALSLCTVNRSCIWYFRCIFLLIPSNIRDNDVWTNK